MTRTKSLSLKNNFIGAEIPEISIGESFLLKKFFAVFPALRNRNYQLYFSGQFISLTGTWLQIVAQSWLVLQLTNSAFLVGSVAAAATLPTFLFALFGGVIVDRFSKRHILITTQTGSMMLAFILGILTVSGRINVLEIIILAFLTGIITAIDSPARQSFVVEMVGKQNLASAIALNSGIFNTARIIGPSLAGLLIATIGTGWAFIINGTSYIAVIIALLFIKAKPTLAKNHLHPLKAIREGIAYAVSHPIIKILLVLTGVVSVFGWSYATIMPVIARDIFHVGPDLLGYLYAVSGVGALISTIIVSAFGNKIRSSVFIVGGSMLFSTSIFLFTFTTNFLVALPFLFLAGLGLLSCFSMINTTLQNLVEDEVRGRIMSMYTIMFIGLSPVGNLQIGFLAQVFGSFFAIRVGAIIVFAFGVFIFLNRGKIRNEYKNYLLSNNIGK